MGVLLERRVSLPIVWVTKYNSVAFNWRMPDRRGMIFDFRWGGLSRTSKSFSFSPITFRPSISGPFSLFLPKEAMTLALFGCGFAFFDWQSMNNQQGPTRPKQWWIKVNYPDLPDEVIYADQENDFVLPHCRGSCNAATTKQSCVNSMTSLGERHDVLTDSMGCKPRYARAVAVPSSTYLQGLGKWHVDRVIPDWVIPHWWRQLAAHQLLADQIPSYWKNNPQDIAASCKEVANILMEQGTLPKVQLKGICQWQLAGASTNCIFVWAFVRTGTLILDHPRVVDSGVVVTSLYNVLEDSNCRNR